ncbi:MAG: hypothetical protein NWR76_04870 [Opitutales bacterium]|nr:hypothetical protein [Opitutales bacterium]
MITEPKKRKINPMLLNVILISLLLHVVAIFILGSITIIKYIIPDDAKFEEPPVIEEIEPPKEVKIEIKQQAAPQNQPMNNLRMKQVGNIAISNIDVELPTMEESFTVSSGIGGLGGGSLLGGTKGSLGMGISNVSVFGLKTKAERLLFIIDANREMVTDKKGGLNSYKIIKDEITDMVGNLSAGTLFNVMLYDRSRTMLYKPQLSSAGTDAHQGLVQWVSAINSVDTNIGLEGNRLAKRPQIVTLNDDEEVFPTLRHGWRGNETAFLTQYALEQDVDAIFFITGYHRGFEKLRRTLNEREEADWQRTISQPSYIKQLEAHNLEKPEMQKRINAEMAKINEERAAKGQPDRILSQRHGIYSNANELKLKWKNPHPGHKPSFEISDSLVSKYFKKLTDVLYKDKNKTEPSINVVLFLAGDENFNEQSEAQLKDYVRQFSGKYRIIRGLNEIQSARSSKETTN